MKSAVRNIKFCYLYRDEGNYKEYGEVIFANPEGLSVVEATAIVNAQLLDGDYFFPKEWGVPLIREDVVMGNWYEFLKFEETKEEPLDFKTVGEFLRGLNPQNQQLK